jgi:predicted Fe-Mo cluster-binding NifX family protein
MLANDGIKLFIRSLNTVTSSLNDNLVLKGYLAKAQMFVTTPEQPYPYVSPGRLERKLTSFFRCHSRHIKKVQPTYAERRLHCDHRVPGQDIRTRLMKIAVTSQNFRTITQHAGKTRRFLIYEKDPKTGQANELSRLNLPKQMSMHEFQGDDHPIFEMDYLITGSGGQGFIRRMNDAGVEVIITSEQDPLTAVTAVIEGKPLPPPEAHSHSHSHPPIMPS